MLYKKEDELNSILDYIEKEDFVLAKSKLNQLLITYPNDYILENVYGFVLAKENNYTDAIFRFRKSININNSFADGYYNLASLLTKIGLDGEAIDNFKKAISIKPNYFEAYYSLANTYLKTSNFLEADKVYRICLSIRPNSIEALNNFGINLTNEKKFDEAIDIFNRVLRLDKDYFYAHNNLGMVYYNINNFDRAITHISEALKIKPDYAEAYNNKGISLNELKLYDEALFNYDQAIKLKPDYAEAYNNKGNTLYELKLYDEALFNYDQAIKLKPDCYDAYFHKALIKLSLGNFEEGWNLYQYRWKKNNFKEYRHPNIKKLETINDLNNKKVLVWYEQGFGDTIQFSRYVSKLLDIGAIVFFEVQKDLVPFFKDQFNCKVNNEVDSLEHFDFQVPLLDLPKLFNTSIKNIFFNRSYLRTQEEKKFEWEKKLNLSKNKLNIGISVSGQPNHKRGFIRSIPLKKMESLFQEGSFFLIQKELNDEDTRFLDKHKEITFVGKEIDNFLDTAAIVENMDLIISVDTSLIHLAGALGKKSFLMLSYSSDWRWLLDRNSTPWYESIKILRQKSICDWDFVINQIQLELNNLKKDI